MKPTLSLFPVTPTKQLQEMSLYMELNGNNAARSDDLNVALPSTLGKILCDIYDFHAM
jgi:hypothetical protein